MSIITQKQGALEYLTAEGITAPHCFTTRLGGISQGYLSSLNIGMHRGDEPENVAENYRILSEAIGFAPENLVLTHQVHTDIVRCVTRQDARGLDHHLYPECDALITKDPGTALVIFTADCTPILLHDPVTGAVGAAHAGWRGTASAIAAKTVEAMTACFGTRPEDIHAAIGPNAGVCHFETDADVPDALRAAFGQDVEAFIHPKGSKFFVDLKKVNELVLRNAGVRDISVSNCCTMCQPDRFWSHRITRGQRGAQGGIILCKGVTP